MVALNLARVTALTQAPVRAGPRTSSLFWTGVPVSAQRRAAWSERAAAAARPAASFATCASSSTTRRHRTP
jgi:hypothetical protein